MKRLLIIIISIFLLDVIPVEAAVVSTVVPFTPQAPSGNWKDQRFQDGCEEASVLMAVSWARAQKLDKKKAETEILKIANWEKKKYGSFRDTSASDTAERLIKKYFGYQNYQVVENITLEKIITAVRNNKLVIIPTNGQKLKNPFFTRPGPDRHMLVVIGYDSAKKEFITNDPGTKRGQSYRYSEKVLYNAIRNYPTGNHLPIQGEKKAGIVVGKN